MQSGTYFKNIETLEDLKRAYRELAMKHHPDRGGDVEVMKAINAEYDKLFVKVKDVHKNRKGETYTRTNAETPHEFKDIIDKLIKLQGVEIEIIGCFIWVSGNTKEHRDTLKQMKFRWHGTKKMWYKAPDGYKSYVTRDYSIDEIRGMYGTSGKFKGKETEDKQEKEEEKKLLKAGA